MTVAEHTDNFLGDEDYWFMEPKWVEVTARHLVDSGASGEEMFKFFMVPGDHFEAYIEARILYEAALEDLKPSDFR